MTKAKFLSQRIEVGRALVWGGDIVSTMPLCHIIELSASGQLQEALDRAEHETRQVARHRVGLDTVPFGQRKENDDG